MEFDVTNIVGIPLVASAANLAAVVVFLQIVVTFNNTC
jgi:hypothetical protein